MSWRGLIELLSTVRGLIGVVGAPQSGKSSVAFSVAVREVSRGVRILVIDTSRSADVLLRTGLDPRLELMGIVTAPPDVDLVRRLTLSAAVRRLPVLIDDLSLAFSLAVQTRPDGDVRAGIRAHRIMLTTMAAARWAAASAGHPSVVVLTERAEGVPVGGRGALALCDAKVFV
ncbi:MAG: hypothetical protein DRO06_04925, partial [Thermoproteota archaeon]